MVEVANAAKEDGPTEVVAPIAEVAAVAGTKTTEVIKVTRVTIITPAAKVVEVEEVEVVVEDAVGLVATTILMSEPSLTTPMVIVKIANVGHLISNNSRNLMTLLRVP